MSAREIASVSAPRQSTTPFRRRLPRFVRAKRSHRPPLALQDRDLDLLKTAHEYRLISTPQYLTLFEEESRDGIYRRLQKLFHHGYLDRIGSNPNAPLVYALGRRGAEVLEVAHRSGAGERYVEHRLMVGTFRIALARACRASGLVVTWRRFPEGQPVRPDGFFGLQFPWLPDGGNRAWFFLEADRSTMPRERFIRKLEAYWVWHTKGGQTAALGIKSFRVLTVTRSEARVRSLVEAVSGCRALAPGLAHFWFATEIPFTTQSAGAILAPVWTTPAEPGCRRSLLP